jgi:hypothetical protein
VIVELLTSEYRQRTFTDFSVSVVDVYYESGDAVEPPLSPAVDIKARSVVTVSTSEPSLLPAGETLVVFMTPIRDRAGVVWSTRLTAIDGPTEWRFLGDLAAERNYDVYLERLVGVLEGVSLDAPATLPEAASRRLEVAVAFAKEQTEVNFYVHYGGLAQRGPMLTAYLAAEEAARAEALLDAWWATPADQRFLDPEYTPGSVLAGLVHAEIYIHVDEAAHVGGVVSVVRTPLGVSHVAELSVGSFGASILVPPGERWEIVIALDPYRGGGTVIDTVDAAETTADFAVFIDIPATVVAEVQRLGFPTTVLDATADLSRPMTYDELVEATAGSAP